MQQNKWKKQFGNNNANESFEVALVTKFKSKRNKHRKTNNGYSFELDANRKVIKWFCCGKLGHISNACRKQLWDGNNNKEHYFNDHLKKKRVNVAKHKEEEEL